MCTRASFLFLTPKSFEQFMGTLWPKNWIILVFYACNCATCSENQGICLCWKLSSMASFPFYTNELWAVYWFHLWRCWLLKPIKIWCLKVCLFPLLSLVRWFQYTQLSNPILDIQVSTSSKESNILNSDLWEVRS